MRDGIQTGDDESCDEAYENQEGSPPSHRGSDSRVGGDHDVSIDIRVASDCRRKTWSEDSADGAFECFVASLFVRDAEDGSLLRTMVTPG